MPEETPVTPEQVVLLAHSGAGHLADLARMSKENFALTVEAARDSGAGPTQDLLRQQSPAPHPDDEQPYTAAIENIANQNPANVKVSAEDHPFFPPNTLLTFAGTGCVLLERPQPFVVTSTNTVGKTFKVDADLSSEPASIITGTVTTVPQQPPVQLSLLAENPSWQAQQKSPKSAKAAPARSPTTTAK